MRGTGIARVLRVGVTAVALLGAAALAVPAAAETAGPANDDIASAQTLSIHPARIVADTSAATAASSDGRCVEGASVWYRFRPAQAATIRLNTVGSNYVPVLAVFSGPRTDRTLLACRAYRVGGQSAVTVHAQALKTYWLAVSSCCSRRSHGGQLVLNVLKSVPLEMAVTVTKIESGAVSGRLHLEGTAHCSTPSFGQVALAVSQRVGSGVAAGSRTISVRPCRAIDSTWSTTINSRTGVAFQAGSAMLTVNGSANNGFERFTLPTQNSVVTVTNNAGGSPN